MSSSSCCSQGCDGERRSLSHSLRDKGFKCWCVADAKAELANVSAAYKCSIKLDPSNPGLATNE